MLVLAAMQKPTQIDAIIPDSVAGVADEVAEAAPAAPALLPQRVPATRMPRTRRGGLLLGLVLGGLAGVLVLESQTSVLQALYFSRWSARLHYSVAPGGSPQIAFPVAGPFDERRGYTRLPLVLPQLQHEGYVITSQARQSEPLVDLIRRGIAPPFHEAPVAGLVIRDARGVPLHVGPDVRRPVWHTLQEIPPLVVESLLFIENRNIGERAGALANPAIDLGRSSKALALYVGRVLGFRWPLEGGSTLATQLEKFRHSPAGHTASPGEKLRQILGASLAAYHEGPATRQGRERIILDYLNTMPLGAVNGIGEVNGLAQGLSAWFGRDPAEVLDALRQPGASRAKAMAYRQVLALLYSVHAPSYYLSREPGALEARIDAYLPLLRGAGVIDGALLEQVRGLRLKFASTTPAPMRFIERKAANAVRSELSGLLGVPNLYDLDRLDLQADTSIDAALQAQVREVLNHLADPRFVAAQGLRVPHLLEQGDPAGITYSVLLMEALPTGNVVRVHTDTRNGPLDLNEGSKLELGSTAKLRTLVHYLELIAQLYDTLTPLPPQEIAATAANARDPLTRWAASTLFSTPTLTLEELLEQALGRKYSADPTESFFTGGGMHHFSNFEPEDDVHELSVRDALVRSSNLVFVRLMRDLVRFHAARLPYDAQAVLTDPTSPVRRQLLREIAAEEAQRTHRSVAWLLRSHHHLAVENRLRTRIERDAFARMTPYWRRLGFPFERLVPSYATALGCSADRPMALAELMGILVNDGRRLPTYDITRLAFGSNTPYETVLARSPAAAEPVIRAPIARVLRGVLGEVVDKGTARRLRGTFVDAQGQPLPIGGKTGSGDNRHARFSRHGQLLSTHPVSRTAVFVFYLGERWYGVITASVEGPRSGEYAFTSSLPLAALKLMAPALEAALHPGGPFELPSAPSGEVHSAP